MEVVQTINIMDQLYILQMIKKEKKGIKHDI